MQIMFNHTKPSHPMYIDNFLEKKEKVKMLKEMGCDVYPKDENDVFVPVDKNTPRNLRMVEETMNEAYGLDLD